MSGAATKPLGVDLPGPYGPVGRSDWMDVDWRAQQRWVLADGVPVNVVELGEGPAVVLVHGLGGAWQNWLENIPALARRHRVVALDLPGFGHSPALEGEVSIERYARLLAAVCDELGLGATALVGNSMGGFISAELELLEPGRAERLVLVSPAGISTENRRRQPLATIARRTAAIAAWTAAHAEPFSRRRRLRRALMRLAAAHPEQLPAPLAAEQIRASGTPGFVDAYEAMISYPLRERLAEIGCPTLLVWGSEDRLVPLRDADVFAELIPDVRKIVFEDTGHVPMLERPAAFNALVERFLAAEL